MRFSATPTVLFFSDNVHFTQPCRFNLVFFFPLLSLFDSLLSSASFSLCLCVSQFPRRMTTLVRLLPTTQSGQTYTTSVSDSRVVNERQLFASCRSIVDCEGLICVPVTVEKEPTSRQFTVWLGKENQQVIAG